MITQLVRNAITLSELNEAKTQMDAKLREAIHATLSEFENKTNVAVASVDVKIDIVKIGVNFNLVEVSTKLDLNL